MADQINISLNDTASKNLKQIAEDLNIPQTEVLRRGLEIMKLYSDASRQGPQPELLLKTGDTVQPVVVVNK